VNFSFSDDVVGREQRSRQADQKCYDEDFVRADGGPWCGGVEEKEGSDIGSASPTSTRARPVRLITPGPHHHRLQSAVSTPGQRGRLRKFHQSCLAGLHDTYFWSFSQDVRTIRALSTSRAGAQQS